MDALNGANAGSVASYGSDELTDRLQTLAAAVFERAVAIFPVATGTAANALALSQIAPPYGAIYCYEAAHIASDECGAPEFFTGGAKLIGLPARDGKIRPGQLTEAAAFADDMGVHHVKPAAVSLTQATEWGTVYSVEELSALGQTAARLRLAVHMDGARFANALAHLGCTPAQATWKCGVDVLSLGATKNGALCAEAVVFFDPERAKDFERRRKRAGHLWSKLRFLSAQLSAYLENELWLSNARHANAMAAHMAHGLRSIQGARLLQSVDANEVFVAMPEIMVRALEAQAFKFYRWPLPADAPGAVSSAAPATAATTATDVVASIAPAASTSAGARAEVAIRLVTSYATPKIDVDDFIAAAQLAALPI
jgi:threonine aldolase